MTMLTGVILAGGQGRRMGGQDKGLVPLNGKPLYQHVLERLRPQVDIVVINANRNIDRYQLSGCRVVQDVFADYPGPLAGIYSALRAIEGDWAVFSSCDTPAIPLNFVEQLVQQRGDAPAVWVRSQERDHPTLALIHRDVAAPLQAYLQAGERRLMQFLRHQGGHAVLLPDDESAFHNINTPDDLDKRF
ncbi:MULTISPECIES: molybdenum cofactor guanylyltransferase MobA [Pantoea]|uniref:Molybdenum cofactor guanylyltransferase n=1 Tax=Pantoea brenneri TaxID=472694 RepID=A0A7Y6TT52_9GAMM|nr:MULTISPECIES: molybdenum cofactor guanylyltransferase MobA [Pantoea]KKD30651.1 molybdopterin-guanine dinucleotide biosynthesis protein MobA [Pantoea sp. 3.5.1]MBZ6396744.1 molybdenum cofactor guanylyltransferase MobA [Pantoea sp.]MBZ6439964.1 molybdenum cofactor guanylyltransferase MobA [Pantoea sp.]MDH1087498.1 molybdenum cofactor guanylyltransferase MobA [Pantoea brenneri]NUY42976.1 molybdenum cofactor guanylyltransferase MobA [Pantoea brenneri]